MNGERPSTYEQLSLEAAARVDAVCDGFEKAWKAARSGAAAPRLSTFLESCDGPERAVLAGELLALDRACRERYGIAASTEYAHELGAGAEGPDTVAARHDHRQTEVAAGRPADWPRVPGLDLVEILGSGGMGVVFRARQVALGRDVAVKFLRDGHRADSAQRERFLQEARAVARLRHPHLVQLHEFGELPGGDGATSQPYLVLEYVAGGSLAGLLRGAPQPPVEAARLVETLANAIHYAHQQGVIHRDLKPANVLLDWANVQGTEEADRVRGPRESPPLPLTADLCAKVTDFGLAKFLAGSDLTHSGDVLGTPNYMAPEQAAGKSAPITAAVDVYGLGAILYEVLTGRPPFQADTAVAAVRQVQHEDPVPTRLLQPTVPRDLETICLKCLRKEPGRRYATAQDLADDLRRFQAREPIRARPVGTTEWFIVWCRRKPGVAALAAALLLVFLMGSSGVVWQWQRARKSAALAEQNAAASRKERDTARQQKTRAEHHLQMVRNRVDRLERFGQELLRKRGMYRTGQAVLEEALAFYREMLPEEGNDPRVRREAAHLFGQVGWIHHTLGQAGKSAEAWGRQASLLTTLLEEEPADSAVRSGLAHTLRWRGNALRDLGKAREAREAYDQAATLQEALLRGSPADTAYQSALANTLLNLAGMLSPQDNAAELEPLYRRILELDRTAVRTAPNDPGLNSELALALEGQGLFFLETGRGDLAEAAVREAREFHQKVFAGGHMSHERQRYMARNFANLGRVLAATGQTREAEESYRKAVEMLDRLMGEFPESAYARANLANTLAGLADLLEDAGRRQEVEEIRRRAIHHYETLKANFPEDREHRRNLVVSYLTLVSLLWQLGRQTEAVGPYRKALELDPEDPAVNNELAWFLAAGPEARLWDGALAVRLAKRAVTAQPESANYRNTLGAAYYRNGDVKAAIAELETSMNLRAGGDSLDWFFLAMAYWRQRNAEKARTWFDRAVNWMDRHRPHDAELRRFRAEAEAMFTEERKHGA
jgi:serine/threonine protein kinase/Tfp pilus assembly protein PilF